MFAATGAVLSFFELLGIVLACNLATIMAEQNAEKKRMAKITQLKVRHFYCVLRSFILSF